MLYNLLESCRIAGVLLLPFMPESCEKLFAQIGAPAEVQTWDSVARWGALPAGVTVTKGPALFPRIDAKKELEALEKLLAPKKAAQPAPAPEKPAEKAALPEGLASIDDFRKLDLRVAKVVACERVPKADKLLCLQLEVGEEKRQVVSGIAAWYAPEDLIGRNVVLLYNLQPARLRGVESCGMLLASSANGRAYVLFPGDELPSGSKIS